MNELQLEPRKREFWCSPDSFEYGYRQMIWLLGELPYLRDTGMDWPPNPNKKSAKEEKVEQVSRVRRAVQNLARKMFAKRQFYYSGRWENCRSIVAHLENRLCAMGRDGAMVKLMYVAGDSAEDIGRYFNLPSKVVKKIIDNRLRQIEEREAEVIRDFKSKLDKT